MGELPTLKALVQRLEDEPFALLGINTDRDKDEFNKKMGEHGVTWRSAWQGSTGGPIPKRWGVRGYPSIYVLDAEGVIRFTNVRGEGIGRAVDELLAEMKAKKEEGEKKGF